MLIAIHGRVYLRRETKVSMNDLEIIKYEPFNDFKVKKIEETNNDSYRWYNLQNHHSYFVFYRLDVNAILYCLGRTVNTLFEFLRAVTSALY